MFADDRARLIYLVVLLVAMLGLFFYGQRRDVGRRMRDFLIWVLIFLMVVIAYGFRDVLREGLFPASTVQISGDTIELRRRDDGHFYADLRVNDEPVRFMIDTGASQIVLSRRAAEAVGIDVGRLNYMGRAMTANGAVATAAVRLGVVQFGDLVDTDVPASVNAGDLDVSLLGMGYLNRFSRIEIVGDRMLLHL